MRTQIFRLVDQNCSEEVDSGISYHHYGAVVLDLPLDQLWREQRARQLAPRQLLRHLDPLTVDLADSSALTSQSASHGATATLETMVDQSTGAQTLSYRASGAAPELAEYLATCTMQPVADEPSKTLVEWTRQYRPAADADPDRSSAVVAELREQDRALAARFSAVDEDAQVLLLDYTLGGAALETRAKPAAHSGTWYAQAA
jgi:hypothetical protein